MSEAPLSTTSAPPKPSRTTVRYDVCGERLLIEDFDAVEKIGNIYLPNGAKSEELVKGKVIAIGPDVKTVRIGDIVVHVPDLGTKLKEGKRTYLMLPENAIIAIDNEYVERGE